MFIINDYLFRGEESLSQGFLHTSNVQWEMDGSQCPIFSILSLSIGSTILHVLLQSMFGSRVHRAITRTMITVSILSTLERDLKTSSGMSVSDCRKISICDCIINWKLRLPRVHCYTFVCKTWLNGAFHKRVNSLLLPIPDTGAAKVRGSQRIGFNVFQVKQLLIPKK